MDRLNVLIIEDQPSDAELIQYYISQLDFEFNFTIVKSEKKLKEILKDYVPDVILSDYKLDGYDGLKALDYCSSVLPNVPFLIITGTLGEELAVKIIKQGASDFILKEKISTLPGAIIKTLRETAEKTAKIEAEEKLKSTLSNLEKLVKERTEKLSIANKALKKEMQESIILSQKLKEKNKEITDSINYAKRIQRSIVLASDEPLKNLGSSFVLWKPKDIVSGDFYWCYQNKDHTFIAAIDCTGHGVPGAMMSIIAADLISKVVKISEVEEPSTILARMDSDLTQILSGGEETINDGMDIALCRINQKTKEISFSGAQLPLFYYDGKDLKVIKGSRYGVGGFGVKNQVKIFTQENIKYKEGDCIFLSSDGYYSQFNGLTGKKMMRTNMNGLLERIVKESSEQQKESLETFFNDWKGLKEQVDDVLVIGIKF